MLCNPRKALSVRCERKKLTEEQRTTKTVPHQIWLPTRLRRCYSSQPLPADSLPKAKIGTAYDNIDDQNRSGRHTGEEGETLLLRAINLKNTYVVCVCPKSHERQPSWDDRYG